MVRAFWCACYVRSWDEHSAGYRARSTTRWLEAAEQVAFYEAVVEQRRPMQSA
jgi:hypothetical protein